VKLSKSLRFTIARQCRTGRILEEAPSNWISSQKRRLVQVAEEML
jgi:hypothetical protein